MTELVTFMVKSLVDKKDAVEVTLTEDGVINVKVDKDDIGKVIGKDGRIAKAIRTIVKAAANKQQAKSTVVILEE